jgi:hypothetical protein
MKHRKVIAIIVSLCMMLTPILGSNVMMMSLVSAPVGAQSDSLVTNCHEVIAPSASLERAFQAVTHCPEKGGHTYHACCHGFVAALPTQYSFSLPRKGRIRIGFLPMRRPILRVDGIFRPPRQMS